MLIPIQWCSIQRGKLTNSAPMHDISLQKGEKIGMYDIEGAIRFAGLNDTGDVDLAGTYSTFTR